MEEVLRFHRRRKTAEALSWIFIILAILSLVAIIVCLVMIGFQSDGEKILNITSLSGLGGILLFGGLGYFLYNRTDLLLKRENDAVERADSPDSFLIGNGTLATFRNDVMTVHRVGAPQKGDKLIHIPLGEVKAYSVCSRRRPREKGEWSVVFEVPAHFLARDEYKTEEGEKVFIQTDAKQRLYESLSAHGVPLLGEQQGDRAKNKKFTRVFRSVKPDVEKRRKALFMMLACLVALGGGVAIAFLLSSTVGTILAVFGVYFGTHAIFKFTKSKSRFSVYEEGIYWEEASSVNNIFLKWEEIERIELHEENIPVIQIKCVCGAYHLPALGGFYEELVRLHGEKCGDAK